MPDRIFFPLVGAAALAMIALSLVWPQGRSAPLSGADTAQPAAVSPPVAPK